jgi:4-amino-4-deoxy-L-arabinose transferase-like glycosyltransferase
MRTASIGAPAHPADARARTTPIARVGTATVALTAIVCLAAVLRLASLRAVPDNLFYDAAVRSMARSWHNFFFAAFEPGGAVSIDKPPIDLWLQVASVKVLGFNSFALKLPEALAGIAAVALAYDVVRRLFGTGAGLLTAAALAVAPITVLTSRSDTMDTVMMMLSLAAAWLVVRAAETGRTRFLYLAAAVIGINFNVKLFEALLPVPALVALYLVAVRRPVTEHLKRAFVATAVFAALALSWPIAVSLAPAANKPYPLGSTNGSVWSSIFVFDGVDRLKTPAPAPDSRASVRAVPPPAANRLFAPGPGALDRQVGSELLPAIMLGALALALVLGAAQRDRRRFAWRGRDALTLGGAVGLGIWLVTGTVGFSAMARLHTRYLEAFTPAVAATLGVALATYAKASAGRRWAPLALLPVLSLCALYALHLTSRQPGLRALVLWTAAVAAVCLLVSTIEPPLPIGGQHRERMAAVASVLVLVLVLAVPTAESLAIVRRHASDSTTALARSPQRLARLSGYLRAHQGAATYEVATRNPWQAAPLIVRDGRPVLIARNVDGRALVPIASLQEKVRRGQVKYVWLGQRCSSSRADRFPACQPLARWTRTHGARVTQVGERAGLWRVHAPAAP